MFTLNRLLKLTPMAALCAAALPALATNGYFPHGFGMIAKGMGGASTALAQDSMGGANNPASMVWAGSRMELGMDVFMPKRDAERVGSPYPINDKVDSDNTLFLVPEMGYNRMVGNDMSVGISVIGNGGMNTTYPQGNFNCGGGPANMLCGGGTLGVDLMQLIVAPTVAYKLNAQHSVGVSLLLAYQQFKAMGLQAFDNAPGFPPFTQAPGSVTDNGYEKSTGVGLRVGYQGHLSDTLSVGVSYAPKIKMGKLDKYKGLFAEDGGFDIPSNYSFGVAFMPSPDWTVAIDLGRINYTDVKSISNPSSAQAPMGAAGGPGFGWKDVNVFKLGVAWRMSQTLTLRAGYNKGDNPISPGDVSFNILAPGVVTNHYTAGFTYSLDQKNDITAAMMVAPRQTVTGFSMFNSPNLFGPGNGGMETIGMKETSFGVTWGHKF